MLNPVPQLTNYAANAYNAKDGNFLSRPVFALTYENDQKIDWGSSTDKRDIPDQISASTTTTHYGLQRSLLLRNKSDYDRSFSVSVEAKYSGVSYSGSIQSSLLYHGSLFSSTSSSYAPNFYLQSILNFERIVVDRNSLDEAFVEAISSLPVNISSAENQQKYFDFFDNYGTHYASFATMGGTVVMETEIEDSLFESFSSLQVNSAISAGYKGVIGSGSLKVNTAYSSSTFLSDHRNSVKIALNVMGGTYEPDGAISKWFSSLYTSPSLLLNSPSQPGTQLTTLKPISELVATAGGKAAIATHIDSLLHAYVMVDAYEDGLLASPQDIPFDRVIDTKAGDGFVLAAIQQTTEGDRGYIQAFSDNGANPTTVCAELTRLGKLASTSIHYHTPRDTWVPYNTAMIPVSKNEFYTAKFAKTALEPAIQLLWMPLGIQK